MYVAVGAGWMTCAVVHEAFAEDGIPAHGHTLFADDMMPETNGCMIVKISFSQKINQKFGIVLRSEYLTTTPIITKS